MRDLSSNLGPVQSLAPAARTASANGAGVDLRDFDGAMVMIDAGSWTDGTHTFEVQESDDNVAFAAVAADDLLGSEPVVGGATDDDQIYKVSYIGTKRYIRAAVTVAGAVTGAVYGVSIVRGLAHRLPVA
ncbi:hypothetical protein H2509_20360 [Stappia sp. F7233]|uniref:Uncharacterized protein n=1 Tax=Stappia albiluteola TaxID=2758565 RepID=A0A839AI14_9HYPH|nr:hypothetical protein [Stappia albiluteola]MBA5779490.1 hypothetical protein [Stappia albiluteola]